MIYFHLFTNLVIYDFHLYFQLQMTQHNLMKETMWSLPTKNYIATPYHLANN
jgi:hypothetical protein